MKNLSNILLTLDGIKKVIVYLAVFLSLCCAISCQRDDVSVPDPNQSKVKWPPINKTIKVENNYLVFEDPRYLDTLVRTLQNYSAQDIRKWSKKLGFVSLRVLQEDALDERLKIGQDELPMTVINHKNAFIVDSGRFEPNVSLNMYSNIVNEDGLVRVGKYLFQYKKDRVIIREYNPITKLYDLEIKNSPVLDFPLNTAKPGARANPSTYSDFANTGSNPFGVHEYYGIYGIARAYCKLVGRLVVSPNYDFCGFDPFTNEPQYLYFHYPQSLRQAGLSYKNLMGLISKPNVRFIVFNRRKFIQSLSQLSR